MNLKNYIICLFFVLGVNSAQSQIDNNRLNAIHLVEYSDTIKDFNFSFQKNNQGLYFGDLSIDGKHKSTKIHIFNNSKDTLFIKKFHSSDGAVNWVSKSHLPASVLPNNSFIINGYWQNKVGPFSRTIVINYLQNNQPNELRIRTWGQVQPFVWFNGQKVNQWIGSVNSGKFGKWHVFNEDGEIVKSIYYENNEPIIVHEQSIGFTKKNANYPDIIDTIPFVTEFYGKTRLKQKEIYLNEKEISYYKNGQIKSVENNGQTTENEPIHSYFFESGKIKGLNYRDSSLTYYESGRIKSYSHDNISRNYYETGELMSFYQPIDIKNDSVPFKIDFYKNSCLKNESFRNQHLISYSENECNCPNSESYFQESKIEVIYKDCVPFRIKRFEKNKTSINSAYFIETGKFTNHTLSQGELKYYNSNDELVFSIVIDSGKHSTSFVFKNIVYNNKKDQLKTGVWIKPPSNFENFSDYLVLNPSLNIFDFKHEIYRNDTIIEAISYYPNGVHAAKNLTVGLMKIVIYYDSIQGVPISGKRDDCEMVFSNGKLTTVVSPKREWTKRYGNNHDISISGMDVPYYIEIGTFKNYKIYNGYIEHYDSNNIKTRTVLIRNGVKQSKK